MLKLYNSHINLYAISRMVISNKKNGKNLPVPQHINQIEFVFGV